ncbi:hypothetical protein NIES4074_43750 [Cylindrospermum sp. NIES-4074]|nr:hypothetical protein NIES4074_43750 [Cylindrospermum sp. NIES-4074]
MLNNSSKSFPSHQLKNPIVGVLIAAGIVGFGVLGQQTQPVLSNQIEKVPTSTANAVDISASKKASLLSQHREVKEQSFESKNLANIEQQLPKSTTVASLSKNAKSVPTKELRIAPTSNFPKQDGIYLYGQSLEANQLGQGYIIFQKQQDRVIGALYVPSSEFSCFQGTLGQSGKLAMTVTGSPGEGGPTEVATASRIPRITDDEPISYAYSVTLQDYHQLNSVSANDRRILQICNQSSPGSYTKLVQ